MAYRTSIAVRFGDVDHAGIVYYPQFYIYFHEAFEDFFNDSGLPYHDLLGSARVGFPTVHVATDFRAPLRYGDSLDIELSVPRVSHRSAAFRYVGYRHRDGQHCVTAEITTACVNMDTFRAQEIPGNLVALFRRFAQ